MIGLKKIRESRGIREVHTRKPISDILSESYNLLFDCEDKRLRKILEAHIKDVRENPKELSKLASNLATLRTLVVECKKVPLKESEGLDDPRIEVEDDIDLDIDTEMKEITDFTDEEPEPDEDTETREEKTETAEELSGSVQEGKTSPEQFRKFTENSRGKIFVKNLAKSSRLTESAKRFNLQESISLYKAANSMMTQMAIELEHNESFKDTFSRCTKVLGESVSRLIESIRREKPIETKVLESLQKFSSALSLREDEEIDDFIDWVDTESEEVPSEDESEETVDPIEVAEDVLDTVAPEDIPAVVEELVDKSVTPESIDTETPLEDEELTDEETEDLKQYLCILRGCEEGSEEAGEEPSEEELDALEERVRYRRSVKEGKRRPLKKRVKESMKKSLKEDVDFGKLKPFSQNDWMGYAGASKLPGGMDPMIYHADTYDLIVSGDETEESVVVEVDLLDDESEDQIIYSLHNGMSPAQGVRVANKLIRYFDADGVDEELMDTMGFDKVVG